MQEKANNITVYGKEFLPDIPALLLSQLPTDQELTLFPGFCDVHVHFRDPGFSYKETIATGTQAAAHGGYTTVCTMPNLDPVPDCAEHLAVQRELIGRDAVVNVYPYGAITVGEKGKKLADLASMADGAAAFSDDGKGVQSAELMRRAMCEAKRLGKVIAAHCEDESLVAGGVIHDGSYARAHGYRGISGASETKAIERDIALVRETGCSYHVCHVSCRESIELIRQAKREGLDITCETAPHYLLLDERALREDGRFKMNPPLRSASDRQAVFEGLLDGTVDMIATDHAPHSAEEKARGLAGSAFGVVGLETAFPLLYTELVRTGTITLDKLINLMAVAPRRRFSLPFDGFTVWDLGESTQVDPGQFLSKGRATPFEGREIYGVCRLTVAQGKTAYHSCGGNEHGKKN